MSPARINLRVLGGAREVGANSHLLTLGSSGLLLDAGLHPRRQGEEALPAFGDTEVEVEDIFISHAHLDHVGALPVALKRFPRARVHLSGPSAPLAIRMLRNAVAIARGRVAPPSGSEPRNVPLYNDEQVEWVEQVLRTHALGARFSLDRRSGSAPSAVLFNAGHLLGAAGLLIEHEGRRIFYTGDTCASAQHISCAARYPDPPVDLLLMDSTHGADPSLHLARDEHGFTTASEELGEFISTVAARGGSVLVPVFALGRCQEILGVLQELRERKRIPPLPIFISGLAHAMARIYDAGREEPGWRCSRLALEDVGYRVLNAERWNDPSLLASPSILAISSGMMFAGTGSHLLAGRMLPDPRHGIAFVGFLDQESPGYRVAQTPRGEAVELGAPFGKVEVACSVRHQGFTGHSRASQLLATVERLQPRRTVLVHGDDQAVDLLAARIRDRGLPTEVTVATPGLELTL